MYKLGDKIIVTKTFDYEDVEFLKGAAGIVRGIYDNEDYIFIEWDVKSLDKYIHNYEDNFHKGNGNEIESEMGYSIGVDVLNKCTKRIFSTLKELVGRF